MKVILQKDIKEHGKKGQMVEVSDGYARNYLFPRKLAIAATSDNINTMVQQEKARQRQLEAEKAEAEAIREKLTGVIVRIEARAGAGGKLFGSITSKEISDELQKQHGLNVEKSRISQADPIKTFGTFEVKCKLGHGINGTINVIITEKK